jgi:hypothetical protein
VGGGTQTPSILPTQSPTVLPSRAPTGPTNTPSQAPTETPTYLPSSSPTLCGANGAAATVTTNSSLNAQIAIWANKRCKGTIVIGRRGKPTVMISSVPPV